MGPDTTARLDAELVRRGLARSRRRATELVAEGRVRVDGAPALKASRSVSATESLEVDDAPGAGYVSRAAHKLDGALDALARLTARPPVIEGLLCLDAGASTGGFTQVLLERGAARVIAVDVGRGQMAPEVADDPRVIVHEGVNVRDLEPGALGGGAPELVVADLSFISLTLVLPALLRIVAPGSALLVMVKPQFEIGRERLGASGVVTSSDLRREAVLRVATAARSLGARVVAVVPSPLPGPSGNREFFLWMLAPGGETEVPSEKVATAIELGEAVRRAVVDGIASLVQPVDPPVGAAQ